MTYIGDLDLVLISRNLYLFKLKKQSSSSLYILKIWKENTPGIYSKAIFINSVDTYIIITNLVTVKS